MGNCTRAERPNQAISSPGRAPAPTLVVWAVLDVYITNATNGVRFSQLERQHLRPIRHAGSEQPSPEEVTAT